MAETQPPTPATVPNTYSPYPVAGSLVQTQPEPVLALGELEQVSFAGPTAMASGSFILTGNGGPTGRYRIRVTADKWAPDGGPYLWTAAKAALFISTNTVTPAASFTQNGQVDRMLAAGQYSWTISGAPAGLLLTIGAI